VMKMNLRHYLRAINAENIKEWKIELTYRVDFIRGLFEPLFYVLPAILYGMAIVGGRYSENLEKLTGTGNLITYTVIGYVFMGFLETAVWGMGFALRKEQWYGTIEQVFAAPVPRWVYVMGMALHSTMHQGLIIIMQSVVIYFIFGLYGWNITISTHNWDNDDLAVRIGNTSLLSRSYIQGRVDNL